MDRSMESCGSERIVHAEEGTSSGRAELGATRIHSGPETHSRYARFDHGDRQLDGQGGKASLANTQ